jgi:hypothetical protein
VYVCDAYFFFYFSKPLFWFERFVPGVLGRRRRAVLEGEETPAGAS